MDKPTACVLLLVLVGSLSVAIGNGLQWLLGGLFVVYLFLLMYTANNN